MSYSSASTQPVWCWRDGTRRAALDELAEEIPVAIEYNATPFAVMMASPADLDDLALGFTLSEGIARQDQYESVQTWVGSSSARLAIEIATPALEPLLALRQRNLVGRSGCGLCGTESLPGVLRPLPDLRGRGPRLGTEAIERALTELEPLQALRNCTGATHAAAWCQPDGRICCVREDVGRHNALDKLIGALAARGTDPASGFALVSSRASFEMVQKAATFGITVLVAVSAPTKLGVSLANQCGQTLIGFARGRSFTAYSAAGRIAALEPIYTSLTAPIDN
jgi:FdhD protein